MIVPRKLYLYFDEACEKTVPIIKEDGEEVFYLSFGHIDEAESKTESFYIRNESGGRMEDLEFTVQTPAKENIIVKLLSPVVLPVLQNMEVKSVTVEWHALPGVKAGECKASMSIKGMLTKG